MDGTERIILALAEDAHGQMLETGYAGFFDESFDECAKRVAASEKDAHRARRRMLDEYLMTENQPGYFVPMSSLILLHEGVDRQEHYRQNEARRHVLKEIGRVEGGGWVQFKYEDSDPYPAAQMFAAARVLDYLGLLELGDGLPAIFGVRLTSQGDAVLGDERVLQRRLPTTISEDEEQLPLIAHDALGEIITSADEIIERLGWSAALDELRAGDAQYADGNWVNAVRDYYSALESGLKYALHADGVTYGEANALEKLAKRASAEGLIPLNYQALFSFTSSIRSPRSHGEGPHGSATRVEIGAAEALLMRHHVRALLLYLGTRCVANAVGARQAAAQ